jgi:hypothetical protein
VYLFARLGDGVPAAVTFGFAAGTVAFVTLRLADGRHTGEPSPCGNGPHTSASDARPNP